MTHSIKMLILGLTGDCNFACTYCYASEQPQEMMTESTARTAIDLAAADGEPFILQLSGGEPLLAFDLIQNIVVYVKEKKIPARLQLQTNGSLITPETASFLSREQIAVGVSLDGRPAENDYCRRLKGGGATSPQIAGGIQLLAAAGVEIGFTCVVTKQNVRQLPGIVEMAHYFGNVRKIGFDLLRAHGRGSQVEPARAKELATALDAVLLKKRQLEKITGKRLGFSHTERVDMLARKKCAGFAHCHAMNGEAAFVDASGKLYACASLSGQQEFCLGDVRTGLDVHKQLLLGERIKQKMRFCAQCASFALCGGACFARWQAAKEPDGPYEPECVLKKAFISDYEK